MASDTPAPSISVDLSDCLEYIAGVPDDSVDMVLVDPPYFIGFDGGDGWDAQWESEAAYLKWCADWTAECVRVLRPGRMLVVWGTLKTDTFLRYKLDVLNAEPDMVGQNEIIWSYNWGGRSKSNFARKHEYAWCYSKGSEFLFNGDDVRQERAVTHNLRTGLPYAHGTIPTAVWQYNNHTMSADHIGWHPTTKNLTVLDRMIRAYTDPGDTVLDIFAGSFSTAVAAYRAGRSFIGCEISETYHGLGTARMHEEMNPVPDVPVDAEVNHYSLFEEIQLPGNGGSSALI